MSLKSSHDCVVIGSGPNGLSAAITLARAGRSVVVFEAKARPGGAVSSAELTLSGFVHDIGSAIFPMAVDTPFFRTVALDAYGLEWIFPPASVAHPFDDGTAVVLYRSLDETLKNLGADARAYERIMRPLADKWPALSGDILRPLHVPRHGLGFAGFGLLSMWPLSMFARCWFSTGRVRALFAGLGAHSILPLNYPFTTAFALVMGMTAHNPGWPIPRGGSGVLARALTSYLESLGGEVVTSSPVDSLDALSPGSVVFFDLTPRQILRIASSRLPEGYRRRLERYRYGPGIFKVDWALDGPIPWKAPECSLAGTVHLGGTLQEIEFSESEVGRGIHPARPFVLCAQQSLFDQGRAPGGRHTAWAYCHVPGGSSFDMTGRIEDQIERFAPGFRETILARRVMNTHELETFDANLVGGDIAGGAQDFWQLFARPVASLNPYAMPAQGLYLCSSSTPPGAGVHGMCGYNAAMAALKREGEALARASFRGRQSRRWNRLLQRWCS